MYEKALEKKKTFYGEDSVKYAYSLGNLSGVLEDLGDY
jgi:hypothetical protein